MYIIYNVYNIFNYNESKKNNYLKSQYKKTAQIILNSWNKELRSTSVSLSLSLSLPPSLSLSYKTVI